VGSKAIDPTIPFGVSMSNYPSQGVLTKLLA
jgi:hypothetical protein